MGLGGGRGRAVQVWVDRRGGRQRPTGAGDRSEIGTQVRVPAPAWSTVPNRVWLDRLDRIRYARGLRGRETDKDEKNRLVGHCPMG